jgi:hypothetical protein
MSRIYHPDQRIGGTFDRYGVGELVESNQNAWPPAAYPATPFRVQGWVDPDERTRPGAAAHAQYYGADLGDTHYEFNPADFPLDLPSEGNR